MLGVVVGARLTNGTGTVEMVRLVAVHDVEGRKVGLNVLLSRYEMDSVPLKLAFLENIK